ncbi:MAG: D-alanyl-D-alanine carboxypeptidase, partial [Hyphomonas sp.]|nr:D-alanyl-D-alanine carboxypeptidase [Hyphomonas sp.]
RPIFTTHLCLPLHAKERIMLRQAKRDLFQQPARAQTWGDAFRATLPVGGQSGSLARRFRGTPLEGRVFAKTGTVQGVNALSGFLIAASGETLVFSVIANDRPADSGSAVPVIDALLLEIAASN